MTVDLSNISEPHGWLDPEGKFHSCRYGEHLNLADHLLNRMGVDWEHRGYGRYGIVNTPEQELEERGWIKVQNDDVHSPSSSGIGDEWFVTKNQYHFIQAYCAEHHKKIELQLRIR